MTYLLKNSNFDNLKFMKICPVIRFLGTFLPGHQVLWRNFARPRFSTRRTSYLPLLASPPPPPPPSVSLQRSFSTRRSYSSTTGRIKQYHYYRLDTRCHLDPLTTTVRQFVLPFDCGLRNR